MDAGVVNGSCDGSCVSAEQARANLNSVADVLKEASEVGQKLVDQRERYAAVAAAAIECIEVMQAHLSHLGAADQKRLAADLKSRGINIESRKSLLGLIARKEG